MGIPITDVPFEGLVITLPTAATITGKIEPATGSEKLPICKVMSDAVDQLDTFCTTEANGSFTLSASPGRCHIHAEGEGYVSPRVTLELAPGEKRDLVLKVERAGSLEVKVRSNAAEDSRRPDFVLLESARPDGSPLQEFLRYDNSCPFDHVLPGSARIVAGIPDEGVAILENVEVRAGETAEIEIPLPETRGSSDSCTVVWSP